MPSLHSSTDILVRVRAASIHRIDERIANGYGRNMRRMIQKYNTYDHQELPLVLGRACAGIVEGVGRNSKSGLEIGDEVWLAAPWYAAGFASQLVVASESRISRKPFIIGFEGAASLPYSGCVALTALQSAELDETNCIGKRILVQDGCSPVGCVLTQLTKKWGAHVTATCNVRSVPVIKALGKFCCPFRSKYLIISFIVLLSIYLACAQRIEVGSSVPHHIRSKRKKIIYSHFVPIFRFRCGRCNCIQL